MPAKHGQRAQGLFCGTLMGVLLCLFGATPVAALPGGENVVAGNASFQRTPTTLDVLQQTAKVIINYNDFSIGAQERVSFLQPGASAVALNRVPYGPVSTIAGQLNANGRIILVNPSGIVFTDTASVSVHGLIASALDMSNEDFLAGKRLFQGSGAEGSVLNNGLITAAPGGEVFLIAPEVINSGVIDAPDGAVGLEAASSVYLTDDPYGYVVAQVDGLDGEASNSGAILSEAGSIDIYGAVVNQDGLTSADSITGAAGQVRLISSDSTRLGPASLTSARSEHDEGGTVHVLGDEVALDGATVSASGATGGGTALIGGNFQGNGDVLNASLTYVGEDSRIEADALQSGDGGKVIVWSDEATAFLVLLCHVHDLRSKTVGLTP